MVINGQKPRDVLDDGDHHGQPMFIVQTSDQSSVFLSKTSDESVRVQQWSQLGHAYRRSGHQSGQVEHAVQVVDGYVIFKRVIWLLGQRVGHTAVGRRVHVQLTVIGQRARPEQCGAEHLAQGPIVVVVQTYERRVVHQRNGLPEFVPALARAAQRPEVYAQRMVVGVVHATGVQQAGQAPGGVAGQQFLPGRQVLGAHVLPGQVGVSVQGVVGRRLVTVGAVDEVQRRAQQSGQRVGQTVPVPVHVPRAVPETGRDLGTGRGVDGRIAPRLVPPQAGREVDVQPGDAEPVDDVAQRVREQAGVPERVVFADHGELEERVHVTGGQRFDEQFLAVRLRAAVSVGGRADDDERQQREPTAEAFAVHFVVFFCRLLFRITIFNVRFAM